MTRCSHRDRGGMGLCLNWNSSQDKSKRPMIQNRAEYKMNLKFYIVVSRHPRPLRAQQDRLNLPNLTSVPSGWIVEGWGHNTSGLAYDQQRDRTDAQDTAQICQLPDIFLCHAGWKSWLIPVDLCMVQAGWLADCHGCFFRSAVVWPAAVYNYDNTRATPNCHAALII